MYSLVKVPCLNTPFSETCRHAPKEGVSSIQRGQGLEALRPAGERQGRERRVASLFWHLDNGLEGNVVKVVRFGRRRGSAVTRTVVAVAVAAGSGGDGQVGDLFGFSGFGVGFSLGGFQ